MRIWPQTSGKLRRRASRIRPCTARPAEKLAACQRRQRAAPRRVGHGYCRGRIYNHHQRYFHFGRAEIVLVQVVLIGHSIAVARGGGRDSAVGAAALANEAHTRGHCAREYRVGCRALAYALLSCTPPGRLLYGALRQYPCQVPGHQYTCGGATVQTALACDPDMSRRQWGCSFSSCTAQHIIACACTLAEHINGLSAGHQLQAWLLWHVCWGMARHVR